MISETRNIFAMEDSDISGSSANDDAPYNLMGTALDALVETEQSAGGEVEYESIFTRKDMFDTLRQIFPVHSDQGLKAIEEARKHRSRGEPLANAKKARMGRKPV